MAQRLAEFDPSEQVSLKTITLIPDPPKKRGVLIRLSYNNTLIIRCCYLGMFIQAMVINLTPLLFIPLKEQYGLTFEQIGRLVLINFVTQMTVDLICCALADRVNPKPLIVLANLLSAAGLALFVAAPGWLSSPYHGLVLGTIVFSIGCGLLEVMLSPIIDAVPSERKAGDMAMLHAFYPIGKVAVILITAMALHLLGVWRWQWIVLAWCILPLLNTMGFAAVKLPPFRHESERQPLRELIRLPRFVGLLGAMLLAGATELAIGQWASAFAEQGLGLSKIVADLAGFGMFGIGMIVGRLWFGVRGHHRDLRNLMIWGAGLSAITYLIIALSPWPMISLLACAPAGLFISLLWPGTISLSTADFPRGGGSMFAMLAAAGDFGAALMPWIVGIVADTVRNTAPSSTAVPFGEMNAEQLGLRAGILLSFIAPLMLAFLLRRHPASPPATK